MNNGMLMNMMNITIVYYYVNVNLQISS